MVPKVVTRDGEIFLILKRLFAFRRKILLKSLMVRPSSSHRRARWLLVGRLGTQISLHARGRKYSEILVCHVTLLVIFLIFYISGLVEQV
jgi:hypothetical protein